MSSESLLCFSPLWPVNHIDFEIVFLSLGTFLLFQKNKTFVLYGNILPKDTMAAFSNYTHIHIFQFYFHHLCVVCVLGVGMQVCICLTTSARSPESWNYKLVWAPRHAGSPPQSPYSVYKNILSLVLLCWARGTAKELLLLHCCYSAVSVMGLKSLEGSISQHELPMLEFKLSRHPNYISPVAAECLRGRKRDGQGSWALAALTEDLGSSPSYYMAAYNHP